MGSVLAVLIALAIALLLWRTRPSEGVPAAVAEAADSGAAAPPMHRHRHHPGKRGVPPLVTQAPASGGAADGGSGAAPSRKTVRSLFEVSALLHRNAVEAAQNVENYCAATATLPKKVFAPAPPVDPDDPSTQLKDAAYDLLPRVSWETQPRTPGTLDLPDALVARLRAAGDNWATALTAADVAGLDFSWMSQLQQFNHWSVATTGPMAEQAATVDPFWLPIPYYRGLMDWAKLRLVAALHGEAPEAALGDVQHLADLIASNGITIAEFQAARIVWYEQVFEQAASAAGLSLGTAAPVFPDEASYTKFHDVTLAGVAFMFPGVDPAVAQRAIACSPNPCVILNESITLRRELDGFTDTPEDDATFALADKSACDQPLFDLLEDAPSAGVEALAGYLGSEPLPLEKLFGPEVRTRAERAP